MEKTSKKESRIVSWPFDGWTATGIVDKNGFVIVAVDYKMDSNVEKGDLWVADTLYTNDIPEQDWDLVRPATEDETARLLLALGREHMNSLVNQWYD